MAQIQFFLVEKTNWMSRTLAYPHPPTLPSPPPQKQVMERLFFRFFPFIVSSCFRGNHFKAVPGVFFSKQDNDRKYCNRS